MLKRTFGLLTLAAIVTHVLLGCCTHGAHACCEMEIWQMACAEMDAGSVLAGAPVQSAVQLRAGHRAPLQIEGHHHHHLPCPKERCQFLDSSVKCVAGLAQNIIVHGAALNAHSFQELLAGHQTLLAAYDCFLHRTYSSTRSLSLTQLWLL